MNRRQKPGRNSPTKSFGKGRGKPNQQGRKGRNMGRPQTEGNKGKGKSNNGPIIEPHRHDGVYIVRGKEESLATVNLIPGETVYGEKKISQEKEGKKVEYRIWNPFRSKLAAAILGGIDKMWIQPGAKVLYLGAASGTTVSHCSDIVGETGRVYAVEFSPRSGRDLVNVANQRQNIIPIIEDARMPNRYKIIVPMVDVIFSDVAQPDQARIVALNAEQFLKTNGHYIISIKAKCIDSTLEPEVVFQNEVKKLRESHLKPLEQVTLEPYERDHAVVVGVYRPKRKID